MITCHCFAAAVIQSRVREAELTELQINQARDEYRYPPAEAARLWFVVADLIALHPMYTASLTTFMAMFQHCVDAAPTAATLEGRMAGLVAFLHGYVHKMVSRGLMHAHKLAFGFVMATAGLRESGVITQQEWELFVKSKAFVSEPCSGSSSSSRAQTAPGWCKSAQWEALQLLESALPAQLQGLCQAVAQGSSNSSSCSIAGPGNSSSAAGWKHLLLQGSLADFLPAHSNTNSSQKPPCLLDELLAAGDVGQQQQQLGAAAAEVVAGATKPNSSQGLGLFVRLLLSKVRCCCWLHHSSHCPGSRCRCRSAVSSMCSMFRPLSW
jgi:hypothetical protein